MAETKPTTTNPGIPTDPAAKPSSPIPNPQSLAAQDSSPLALSHQPSTTPQAAAPNPPPAETAATLPPDAGVRHDAIASTVQVPVRSHQLPVRGMQAATPPRLATKEDRPATGLALPMPVSNADSRKSDTEAIAAPTGGEGSTSKKESPWKPSPPSINSGFDRIPAVQGTLEDLSMALESSGTKPSRSRVRKSAELELIWVQMHNTRYYSLYLPDTGDQHQNSTHRARAKGKLNTYREKKRSISKPADPNQES